MSLPRRIIPGSTWFITRRCSERRMFLKPSKTVTSVFSYCLAIYSAKYNIQLHAGCVMSNHYHLVLTDNDGLLPKFIADLNRSLAKCLNIYYRRNEALFSSEDPCYIHLCDEEAVINKIAYVLGNPAHSAAIRKSSLWPGLRFGESAGEMTAIRPDVYFRKNNKINPEKVTLTWQLPKLPSFKEDTLLEHIKLKLNAMETSSRGKHRRFGTLATLKRLSPFSRPHSAKQKSSRRPCVSAECPKRYQAALNAMKAFYQRYKEAKERWLRGEHSFDFPEGTYQIRLLVIESTVT